MNFSEAAARLLLITPHFPYRKYLARLIKNTEDQCKLQVGTQGHLWITSQVLLF